MCTFYSIWALLKPEGEYKRRRDACERLWAGYSPEMQQHIFDTLNAAKQRGDRISPNPYFAIEDVALGEKRKHRTLTLSYAEYYARYHTTEPRDGWRMANPTGNKVIYIRN